MGRTTYVSFCLCAGLLVPCTASAKRVVYINTDPVTIVDTDGQDPTMNSYSANGFSPGPVTGWPELTDDQKQELLYWMREAAVPFDITFTLERPMSGTYDMVVFGTDTDFGARFPGLGGCSVAVGLADCDDASAENIGFLFYGCMGASDQMDMKKVAFNAFTALGFGWGLEQVSASGQIMGSYTFNALQFGDNCVAIQGVSQCSHVGCADGQQNSTADLDARIGPRTDDGPPTVTITSPADGAMVPNDFTVTADVQDAFGGLEVSLTIVEAMITDVDDEPPLWAYRWDLTSVPNGLWTLQVSAKDADGNVTDASIQVCVGDAPCDGGSSGSGTDGTAGTGTGSTDGTGGSSGEASGTSGAVTSTTAPPPPTASGGLLGGEPDVGCGCITPVRRNAPPPHVRLLVVVLAAAHRRGRRPIPRRPRSPDRTHGPRRVRCSPG